jgi:hypothetical protein
MPQGQDIHHNKPNPMQYYHYCPEALGRTNSVVTIDIFINDEDVPPARMTDRVKKLTTLRVAPAFDAREVLPAHTNPEGVTYRKRAFDVIMFSTGTRLTWEVVVNGKVLAKENISIATY